MHNNRGYQEVMHLQRMASLHKRRVDTAWVGNIIDNPAIDFAKLAQSHGGPRARSPTPEHRAGAAAALKVVKSGAPALVDVVVNPDRKSQSRIRRQNPRGSGRSFAGPA